MSIDIWRIVTLVLACTVVLRPHAGGGRSEGLAGPLGDEGPLPLPEPELVVRDPGLAAGGMPTRLRTALAYREEARAACASGEMARLVEAAEHSEDLLAVARDYDEHPAVRILAVESLSFLAPLCDGVDWFARGTVGPKAPAADHPIWEASHAVLELGEPAAALFAETLASDKGRKLRRQAAWYLGRLGIANEEIAGALLEALGDADAIVAADAARALGAMHTGSVLAISTPREYTVGIGSGRPESMRSSAMREMHERPGAGKRRLTRTPWKGAVCAVGVALVATGCHEAAQPKGDAHVVWTPTVVVWRQAHAQYLRAHYDIPYEVHGFDYLGEALADTGETYYLIYATDKWTTAGHDDVVGDYNWHYSHRVLVYNETGRCAGRYAMVEPPDEFLLDATSLRWSTGKGTSWLCLDFAHGVPSTAETTKPAGK